MTTEIITKNGKNYAVIPYEFYQQLMKDAEMLADIKAYDDVKHQSEENFPASVVDSIFLQEENPIKVYREYRNLSILKLAEKTNINIDKLAEIENDISLAEEEELKIIAEILRVDFDMLIL
jgi:ribosome-binding protein aMBF1 (putative translation factor)